MRSTIVAVAVACFLAAVAITGAGVRLPAPPPAAEAPRPAAALPPHLPDDPAAPLPEPRPGGSLQDEVESLAREQAADRALVSQLQATVEQLREELAKRPPAAGGGGPAGETLAVLGDALFPPGSAVPVPRAAAAVRLLVPDIQADPRLLVSVEGHTDAVPIRAPEKKPFKDNVDLSLLRARAIADILAAEGVAGERLRTRGWGDARPRATNATEEGRRANRRVEVRLVRPPLAP